MTKFRLSIVQYVMKSFKLKTIRKMLTRNTALDCFLIKCYNFSAITCIKYRQLTPSKFIAARNFLICSSIMVFVLTSVWIPELEYAIYNMNTADMPLLSFFSWIVIHFNTLTLIAENFVIIFIHSIRHEQIATFIKKINTANPLTADFASKYLKMCLRNLIFQIAFQFFLLVPELYMFTRRDHPFMFVVTVIVCYYYIPNIAFINFVYNFKKFIVTVIQQSREKLEKNVLEDALNDLFHAGEMTKEFHSLFGLQLSIVAMANATLVVLGVSVEIDFDVYEIY
jgi:hypothetical protein